MISRYFITDNYNYYCDREPAACPVCGRYHGYRNLDGYWCPYCGTEISTEMLIKLKKLTGRVDIIEKFLQWGTQLQEEEEKQEGE